MKAKDIGVDITEIISGELTNPNIPDFSNSTYECTTDKYDIMGCMWKGYYVFGILDKNNKPKSYCILKPPNNNISHFIEVYTDPQYRNKNLAGIIILAIKGRLGLKLLIDKTDTVSKSGRNLLLKMCKNGYLDPIDENGKKIPISDLEDIFNTLGQTNHSIIFEGAPLNKELFSNDPHHNTWWYLRDSEIEID